jgi:hypothetical protein
VPFWKVALFVKYLRSLCVYRLGDRCPKIGLRPVKPRAKAMRMNFGEVFEIRDLGKHSAVTVICLGIVLAGTVNVTPDSKRRNCYEVEEGSTIYYIYVSPVTGTIYLIATWNNTAPPMPQLDVAAAGRS